MKINKLAVESNLSVDVHGNVTGWFELPAAPHTRYTIEFHGEEVATPEVEEIDLEDVCEHVETNQQGACLECGEQVGGQEQVLLPGGKVADVTAQKAAAEQGTIASDDKSND